MNTEMAFHEDCAVKRFTALGGSLFKNGGWSAKIAAVIALMNVLLIFAAGYDIDIVDVGLIYVSRNKDIDKRHTLS